MAKRSRDWNEGLAEDLQDPEFARQFLTAAVEDGVPLKAALAKVIRATGVKEFSMPWECRARTYCARSTRSTIQHRKPSKGS